MLDWIRLRLHLAHPLTRSLELCLGSSYLSIRSSLEMHMVLALNGIPHLSASLSETDRKRQSTNSFLAVIITTLLLIAIPVSCSHLELFDLVVNIFLLDLLSSLIHHELGICHLILDGLLLNHLMLLLGLWSITR